MKIRILTACLAASSMAFFGSLQVCAAAPEGIFDADYYASAYPDLQAAFGNDREALYDHFLQHGIAEGRQSSPVLDVRAYRTRYPDLQAAFGDNWDAYIRHYADLGILEGRSAAYDGQAAPENAGDADDPNRIVDIFGAQYMDSLAQDAFTAVNGYRAAHGLAALAWDDSVCAAAKVRAAEIVTNYSHNRPDASGFYTALLEQGIPYKAAAENIAYGNHLYTTGAGVALGWYESEGHRNNMLNGRYTKAAVACYYNNGMYYWANLFTD